MSLIDRDLFEIWRWTLAVACSLYALVVTLRWLAGWLTYLGQPLRERTLIRRYIVLHLLRLRGGRFRAELLKIVAYSAAIVVVYWLHEYI
ncbi:MAG: hypothetical protein KDA33_12105 [Phycisphaerales bacterium]|nr:hypothetical protein [Phycisphaerales bacterium]